jgi:hypothetical protein
MRSLSEIESTRLLVQGREYTTSGRPERVRFMPIRARSLDRCFRYILGPTVADSPLEEDGFELLVPPSKRIASAELAPSFFGARLHPS